MLGFGKALRLVTTPRLGFVYKHLTRKIKMFLENINNKKRQAEKNKFWTMEDTII
jgi:hypothetical protein